MTFVLVLWECQSLISGDVSTELSIEQDIEVCYVTSGGGGSGGEPLIVYLTSKSSNHVLDNYRILLPLIGEEMNVAAMDGFPIIIFRE